MSSDLEPNDELNALADEHRRWLSSFDFRHSAKWETLYRHNYEAAMTEAGVRRLLQLHCVIAEPSEKLDGDCGGPDFRCSVAALRFYVEVTCISIATAQRKTEISNITGMTEAIFNECINKASQCADLDAPVLLAIGTFHDTAAMTGFDKMFVNMALTGQTKMAWDINPATGQESDTYHLTEFKRAAFLRPDPAQIVGFARCSISGLLLINLGSLRTIGVLHPNATQRFDPMALPDIEFGRVEIDRDSGQLFTTWSRGRVA